MVWILANQYLLSRSETATLKILDHELQIESSNHWSSLNRPEFTANLELETVTITGNTINSIGVSLKNHKFLRELRLCDNPNLELHPDDVDHLNSTSLRILHLDGCDISRLPNNTFAHLPGLNELNLERNHLATIPYNILHPTNISILSLSNNHEFNFRPNSFVLESPTLTEFRCNDCGINVIYDETFVQLPLLSRIELNRNQITVVHFNSFVGNSQLSILQLNQNRLTAFPITSFRASNLRELCLDGNNFTAGVSTNILKQQYTKLNLRGQCSQNVSHKLDEDVPRPGISDAFIATYLVLIVVLQGLLAALLIGLCLRQVFGKKEQMEFEYSDGVLNDSDIYRYVK